MNLPRVTKVESLGGYRIHLEFSDGVSGELDLVEKIKFRGVFAPLRDKTEFARVRVSLGLGTIVWLNGADICPDVLYSWVTGKPVPSATADDGYSNSVK